MAYAPRERNDIYLRAIDAFGEDMQLTVAIEELSELIQAICKRQRGHGNLENLSEEMADVLICLDQMALILDNQMDVQRYIQAKTARLEERIESHALRSAGACSMPP